MDDTNTETPLNELDMLKARAEDMGIPFRSNIGVDTLRQKINDFLAGNSVGADDEEDDDPTVAGERKLTKAEQEQQLRDKLCKEKLRLRRVQIYNLNPAKMDLQGEIITVGNRYIGTVRKFIPFGEATEGGYHIEQVLYDHLKARKFQQIRIKKGPNGEQLPEIRWVPEYNIVDMPDLTQSELEELKLNQAAANRAGT